MAINTLALDVPLDETSPKTKISPNCSKNTHGGSSRRLVKTNFAATEGSVCSSKDKRVKLRKNNENASPYLMGDTIHSVTVERFIEKTLVHKKGPEYSSFPFAANLYKANSDEFKNLKKKNTKKVKKSVLTLPNNPTPVPQPCTVSDMNDSDNSLKKLKKKPTNIRTKNSPIAITKRNRAKPKEFGFYDRDAQYCTEFNIDLDCSSTEIIKGNGRGKKLVTTSRKTDTNKNINLSNVWAALRHINRFQFRPSPPMSEDSFETPVKKKPKRYNNTRRDVRVVEATRAQEYAYITRVDLNRRGAVTRSSPSSSNDKLTVIDKEFYKKLKPPNALKSPCNKLAIQNNKFNKGNDDRIITRKQNNGNRITPNNNKSIPRKNLYCKNIFEDIEVSSTSTFAPTCDNRFFYNNIKPVNDLNVKGPEPMEFVYSEYSGSSKAALAVENNKKTFVVTSKPKPRQTPAECNNQQNLNEIRRQVAKLKFPINVLGRDQLSSSFKVVNPEFSQFSGLEEAVWPFMVKWQKENHGRQGTKCKKINSAKKQSRINGNRKIDKSNNEFTSINRESFNTEKRVIEPKVFIRNKTSQKRITPPEELDSQIIQEHEKPKQITQFKDKMLKLLYKSSSSQSFVGENNKTDTIRFTKRKSNRNSAGKRDTGTDSCLFKDPSREYITNAIATNKKSNGKHSWAKGRWASEFIDNVIKKIKTGVYYSLETKAPNKVAALKEVHVQTMNDLIIPESEITQLVSIPQTKPELLFVLPGFEEDNILPKLEIKSMNMKEISVKHCTTNIMVRFDVTVPTEPLLNSTRSNSLIPLTVTDSHTKIFKCKTNIINAMLPEELCSVLPSILSNINNSTECSAVQSKLNVEKLGLNLLPIPEITGLKSPETVIASLPLGDDSKELTLLVGSFSVVAALYLKFKIIKPRLRYSHILTIGLLPNLRRSHFFDCEVDPSVPSILIKPEKHVTLSSLSRELTECKALEPYPTSKQSLIPRFDRFDFLGILENISNLASVNWLRVQQGPWIETLLNKGIKFIKLTATNTNGFRNSIIFDVSKFANTVFSPNSNAGTRIDNHHTFDVVTRPRFREIENEVEKKKPSQAFVLNNKIKRQRFVKVYKKCKSTSSILGDRASTPLNKISNLDDFFLALGSGKMLAGVFDQFRGRKIMSSLVEMKTWISEINPSQALLVLLLNNKKDTPNLVRYRPVILQGIAMNRITKANELDMEIEVIERENMNKINLCEGISYLPASAENKHSLYEELYWIAKTTASDYQTTFDESSEQLLKSLIQKRKKLNPSYLRVMARYVGLGLLRAPNKK